MPSHNTYHLTWVSLTLDEGYLLRATPPDLGHVLAPLGRHPDLRRVLLGILNSAKIKIICVFKISLSL